MSGVESVAGRCELHRVHIPRNLTVEFHHVVPVAWQLVSPCVVPPSPGKDPDGRGMLWDDRGVWLCPTGHRNVHDLIVVMMHAMNKAARDDPAVGWVALAAGSKRTSEARTALEGLSRYVAGCGGSLLRLATLGEWGQS